VKLILDTHTLFWFPGGDRRLSSPARAAIEDLSHRRLFGIAGAWEIAIKVSPGKLNLSAPFHQLVPTQLHANGIELLQLRHEPIAELSSVCRCITGTQSTGSS
jgi:PIN domain nuclease of toxin-antitoxin system